MVYGSGDGNNEPVPLLSQPHGYRLTQADTYMNRLFLYIPEYEAVVNDYWQWSNRGLWDRVRNGGAVASVD